LNYEKVYNQIIERSKNRVTSGYTENHHIVPKCLGGSDDPENISVLYPEEHFLLHVLLVKIYPENSNLILAVNMMCSPVGQRPRRKLYGWLRRRFVARMSEIQKGSGNNQYGSFWITDGSSSVKLPANAEIPDGWRKGRTIKKAEDMKQSKCIDCNNPTGTRRRKRCSEHHHENLSKLAVISSKNLRGVFDGKVFITDGTKDKLHPVNEPIPQGFKRGRSNNKHLTRRITK
jgi:hypothetical protein